MGADSSKEYAAPAVSLSITFAVELVLLAVAGPVLLFSRQFPPWALGPAIALVVGGWIWRRIRLGQFFTSTPIDWPLLLLFGVMLPVSIWAAPPALRTEISIPRALVMVWNYCLLWTIITYASRRYQLALVLLVGFALAGVALAAVSLLGTQWLYKFPGAQPVLGAIPAPLRGAFAGAEEGFHPNQVAGTLLYVFPLLLTISASYLTRNYRIDMAWPWLPWIIVPAALFTGVVIVLAQSRSALLGLTLGVVFIALVQYRWGRIALIVGAVALMAAAPFVAPRALDVIADAPPVEAMGGTASVENFRRILWAQALAAATDFPLTGMGLGTFRELVRVLYPLDISPSYDIGHAHNFFLQTALDFGAPGLIALAAMFLVAVAQLVRLWRWRTDGSACVPPGAGRVWATGLAGSLLAQTIYSQLDAVAMGAKTNFMFWYLLALIVGLANLAASTDSAPAAAAGEKV